MKVLMISLFILLAQSSYAQVLKQQIDSPLKNADIYFIEKSIQYNKEQGTAWVEVEYVYTVGENSDTEYLRLYIPGLSYSAQDHAVVYDNGVEVIKCIELQPRKALGIKWRRQVENPRCHIDEVLYEKSEKVDNSTKPWKDQNELRKYTLTYYYFVIDELTTN